MSQHGNPETPVTNSEHLTVRAIGPVEVRFLFEQPENKRISGVLGAGLISHLVVVGLLLLLAAILPERVYQAVLPERLSDQIVWLPIEGPGGGGGGADDPKPEPPKKAELPGQQKVNVPAVQPPEPTPEPPKVDQPPPEVEINIPAQTMAAATQTSPGVIESENTSGSAGSGSGTGAGDGRGSGLGPGSGGGTGGGVFRPGSGIQLPRVLREVKPQYTSEAMRAKVQGTVLLECVVLPDGSVGMVEVVRSLDSTFGLDQQAVLAAKQWRFAPGTRFGEPVPVLVTIELTFTLR